MSNTIDRPAVSELVAYAIHARRAAGQTEATVNGLSKHYKRGRYTIAGGEKAFGHVAEFAAREYVKEHCDSATKWHDIFNAATRRGAASELEKYYRENVPEMLNAPAVITVELDRFGYDTNGNRIALHCVREDGTTIYRQKRRSQTGCARERANWANEYVRKTFGEYMILDTDRVRGSIDDGYMTLRYTPESIDAMADRNSDK